MLQIFSIFQNDFEFNLIYLFICFFFWLIMTPFIFIFTVIQGVPISKIRNLKKISKI